MREEPVGALTADGRKKRRECFASGTTKKPGRTSVTAAEEKGGMGGSLRKGRY